MHLERGEKKNDNEPEHIWTDYESGVDKQFLREDGVLGSYHIGSLVALRWYIRGIIF